MSQETSSLEGTPEAASGPWAHFADKETVAQGGSEATWPWMWQPGKGPGSPDSSSNSLLIIGIFIWAHFMFLLGTMYDFILTPALFSH